MNRKLSGYSQYDRKGNLIFDRNNGLSGPITMINAYEYDSLNRWTKWYSVHSNLGFSVSETLYVDCVGQELPEPEAS